MDWASPTDLDHARVGQAQVQHFAPADSHSPHSAIGGLGAMEFAHGVSASPHTEYVPSQVPSSHQHLHPHALPVVHSQSHGHPTRDARYGHTYATSPQYPGSYYNQQPHGQSYSGAPRELAEMGLAPQHSGMDQRWTSFMQEGLYFPNSGI